MYRRCPHRHPLRTPQGSATRNTPADSLFRSCVAYLVAVVLGLAFGAADQQLGTLTAELGPWTSTAAQVSAPWLILPFLFGTTQERAQRAAVLGLVVTGSALVGYSR